MRKILIILVALIITALNINAYGDLDPAIIENSKLIVLEENEENIFTKTINWGFGSTLFKLIHFAELMFISEISRKKFTN
ncbi:hypothetical protein [Polaribacter glomeratus]|uniref:Uncharacterized protein n=1 Tax=Polaribacter glomeratus TaxID=102 RepID=A0A2S7WVZ4_9FLAO|nr:hypothetical protein [Polaribacter glomeratus]PQJ81656.1 hypothetical protein BTO16_03315 [Polaribacter glomeratus]TXD66419.1 hypothetical protein ESX12_06460 [Polaribacter glomeratus]